MDCYIRVYEIGHRWVSEIWEIDERSATRLGIVNAKEGTGTYFEAGPGETMWQALQRMTPWFGPDGQNPFHKTTLAPGQYFPRMARPNNHHPHETPGHNPGAMADVNYSASALSQLMVLAQQLERICQTVQPTESTFDVFGHDIRNLLILASTEVESLWRGILVSNGKIKRSYKTEDYVQLKAAMRLDDYAVSYPKWPWIEPIKPFIGWDVTLPTQTLGWYDAYNAVKHNREGEFARGTLKHAFEAVTACFVMLVAQYGFHLRTWQSGELETFFRTTVYPGWSPSDVYISPSGSGDWSPVYFNF